MILSRFGKRLFSAIGTAILSNAGVCFIPLILYNTAMRVSWLKLSLVEKRRLERPTPTSRTWCATNCATSRNKL